MLPKAFDAFIEQRPVCVMARAVVENFFQADRLDALFDRTAERQYQRSLLFSAVVELMHSVVLGVEPSVYAAYRRRRHALGVSDQAVYDKLDRMETGLSAELVRDSARRAAAAVDALPARREPWLPGYRFRILDGNHLSATEHRLEELRTTWAAPLPGKALVVLEPETGLAVDVFLSPDGHAQERSLLDEVSRTVCEGDVWMADRNFCTAEFLLEIAKKNACFLIRQHGGFSGVLKGPRRFVGDGSTGRVYEQEVASTFGGETRTYRRVSVELETPTRDGDAEVDLLTNLPEEVASGVAVAELYRERWTIETLFLEVTQTLACEIRTLCYPKAALFVFCLALLAANAVAVLKAALRAAHGEEKADELSGYYLALEIKQTHDGMMIALPPPCWEIFNGMSAAKFADVLKEIAGHVDLGMHRKTPRGPKKPPTKRSRYKNGGHVSTHKLLTKDDP
ncbi:MAG: transposase [Planctomycetia bacterium]